ncbi:hypothetical protein Tco_0986762 [Tanacetum coccineum]
MMKNLKYVGGYRHAQLKKKKFEEIQVMYEKVKRANENFIPIGSAKDEKLIAKMNKKAAGMDKEEVFEEAERRRLKMKAPKRSKRQKTDSDHEEENQLRTFLKIVPEEEENIDYDVLGTRMDLVEIHSLVMKRFETTPPEGIDLLLWGDLRIMFESKEDDELWKNQEEWKLQSWILYENCEVHVLRLEDGTEINMLAERRYPLTKNTLERMMDLRLTAVSDDDTVFDLLRFIEQHIDEFGGQDGTDSLLKTIWLSIHLVVYNEELAIPKQTATEGKLKENQGCRVDTDQVHQNGDLKNRSVWIHPPGLQDNYLREQTLYKLKVKIYSVNDPTRSVSIRGSRGALLLEVDEERLHRSFTRSASIGGSRGAPPSEFHEEHLHRRFTRSVSIGGSRGALPSEVHEERLHQRFTRSAFIGGSRGAPPSEFHKERFHRRFRRSASIGGSPSEVYSLEDFDRIPHNSISFGSTTKAFQAEKKPGFDQRSNTEFPRGTDLVKEISTNIGGEFKNLRDSSKCGVSETSKAIVHTHRAINSTWRKKRKDEVLGVTASYASTRLQQQSINQVSRKIEDLSPLAKFNSSWIVRRPPAPTAGEY